MTRLRNVDVRAPVAEEGLDPTTLAVLRGALQQVATEMDLAYRLTAFSPVVAEGKDSAAGLYNAKTGGGVISQGESGLPLFVGNMQFAVKRVLEQVADVRPGDVLIVNDPYDCGTHLLDVKLLTPFYWEDELVIFLANTGHWTDIGGATAGGFSTFAREIYQEGVRIPPVKLIDRGALNTPLLDVLLANMRVPEERRGDLDAQLNALQRGRERLREVFTDFGGAVVEQGVAELRRRSEAAMRATIEQLPDGTYKYEDYLDNDGVSPAPLRINLALTISGDQIRFDFTGSSERCAGPMNNPANNTRSACYIALKQLFPELAINEGTFLPVDFTIPADSFLDARFPSPVSGSAAEVTQAIISVCFGTLAEVCPTRAYAQPFSTSANLAVSGEDDGKTYVVYLYAGGGLGAHADGDGLSNAMGAASSSTIPPMEVWEERYPFRIREYSIRRGSGGEGHHKGGDGVVLEIELLRGRAHANLMGERASHGPRGILGGEDAAPSVFEFIRNGHRERPPFLSKAYDVQLEPGDRIRIETPGGGGYGTSR